jgi:hypothetical protein
VSDQFAIFGAFGALTFAALSGLLLHFLLPIGTTLPTGTAPADDSQPGAARLAVRETR